MKQTRFRVVPDPPSPPPPTPGIPGAGTLAMKLFLASLSMLFLTSMVAYAVVRMRAPVWPPPGLPALPDGLWVSTAILLLTSLTLHRALTAIRRGRPVDLKQWLLASLALGLSFLVAQWLNWTELFRQHLTPRTHLYGFTFFLLTGLHAAHVVGGLVPLAIVTARAMRNVYRRDAHQGVLHVVMYWHFLDVVWILLALALVFRS